MAQVHCVKKCRVFGVKEHGVYSNLCDFSDSVAF